MARLLIISALSQLIGFAAGTFIGHNIFSPIAHGLIALVVSRNFKLPGSWQLINFIMPVILFIPIESSLIPLAVLTILLLFYLPTLWTKVPYYPTNKSVIEILSSKLPNDSDFIFSDFGSGFGGVLFDLSPNFPKGRFVGYELGVVPYLFSKIRSLFYPNVKIYFKSFWKPDWKDFDFIYAFLSPQPMKEITTHYQNIKEKRPVFFVNSFPLHIKENEKLQAESQVLYLYV